MALIGAMVENSPVLGPQGVEIAPSQVSKLDGALVGLPLPLGSMIILDLGNLVLAPHLIPPRLIFPPNQDLERKFLKYAGGAALASLVQTDVKTPLTTIFVPNV